MLVPCQTNVIIIVLFSNVGAYVTTIVLFSAPTCVHTFAPMLILLSYLNTILNMIFNTILNIIVLISRSVIMIVLFSTL